jgi:hypothetical protein
MSRNEFLRKLGRNPQDPYGEPLPSEQLEMLPKSTDIHPGYGVQGYPVGVPAKPDLISTPTSEWIPDVASSAYARVHGGEAPDKDTGAMYEWHWGPDITVYPENIESAFGGARNRVVSHEVGHSIYENNMSKEHQAQWKAIHDAAVQPYIDAWFGKGMDVDRARMQIWFHGKSVYPQVEANKSNPFARYWDDDSHSFADAFGYYVSNPEWLKKTYPAAYDFFRNKLGFEYSRAIGK